jgi:hypothetical protein
VRLNVARASNIIIIDRTHTLVDFSIIEKIPSYLNHQILVSIINYSPSLSDFFLQVMATTPSVKRTTTTRAAAIHAKQRIASNNKGNSDDLSSDTDSDEMEVAIEFFDSDSSISSTAASSSSSFCDNESDDDCGGSVHKRRPRKHVRTNNNNNNNNTKKTSAANNNNNNNNNKHKSANVTTGDAKRQRIEENAIVTTTTTTSDLLQDYRTAVGHNRLQQCERVALLSTCLVSALEEFDSLLRISRVDNHTSEVENPLCRALVSARQHNPAAYDKINHAMATLDYTAHRVHAWQQQCVHYAAVTMNEFDYDVWYIILHHLDRRSRALFASAARCCHTLVRNAFPLQTLVFRPRYFPSDVKAAKELMTYLRRRVINLLHNNQNIHNTTTTTTTTTTTAAAREYHRTRVFRVDLCERPNTQCVWEYATRMFMHAVDPTQCRFELAASRFEVDKAQWRAAQTKRACRFEDRQSEIPWSDICRADVEPAPQPRHLVVLRTTPNSETRVHQRMFDSVFNVFDLRRCIALEMYGSFSPGVARKEWYATEEVPALRIFRCDLVSASALYELPTSVYARPTFQMHVCTTYSFGEHISAYSLPAQSTTLQCTTACQSCCDRFDTHSSSGMTPYRSQCFTAMSELIRACRPLSVTCDYVRRMTTLFATVSTIHLDSYILACALFLLLARARMLRTGGVYVNGRELRLAEDVTIEEAHNLYGALDNATNYSPAMLGWVVRCVPALGEELQRQTELDRHSDWTTFVFMATYTYPALVTYRMPSVDIDYASGRVVVAKHWIDNAYESVQSLPPRPPPPPPSCRHSHGGLTPNDLAWMPHHQDQA